MAEFDDGRLLGRRRTDACGGYKRVTPIRVPIEALHHALARAEQAGRSSPHRRYRLRRRILLQYWAAAIRYPLTSRPAVKAGRVNSRDV